MNLEQTIAELDKQAAKYAEAANGLRALLQDGGGSSAATAQPARATRGRAKQGSAKTDGRKKVKRVVSPETRARLAESMRARHQQKREQKAASQA